MVDIEIDCVTKSDKKNCMKYVCVCTYMWVNVIYKAEGLGAPTESRKYW